MNRYLLLASLLASGGVFAQRDTMVFRSAKEIDALVTEKQTFVFCLVDSADKRQVCGSYKSGKKANAWVFFQDAPLKSQEMTFRNDSVAEVKIYDYNGTMQWTGTLYKGKRQGVWKKYSKGKTQFFVYDNGDLKKILPIQKFRSPDGLLNN